MRIEIIKIYNIKKLFILMKQRLNKSSILEELENNRKN